MELQLQHQAAEVELFQRFSLDKQMNFSVFICVTVQSSSL